MKSIARVVLQGILYSLVLALVWGGLSFGRAMLWGSSRSGHWLTSVLQALPRATVLVMPIAVFLCGLIGFRGRRLRSREAVGAGACLAVVAALVIQEIAPRAFAAEPAANSVSRDVLSGTPRSTPFAMLLSAHEQANSLLASREQTVARARLIMGWEWEWYYRFSLPLLVLVALPLGVRVRAGGVDSPQGRVWQLGLAFLLLVHIVAVTIAGAELSSHLLVPPLVPLFVLIFVPAVVLVALSAPQAQLRSHE